MITDKDFTNVFITQESQLPPPSCLIVLGSCFSALVRSSDTNDRYYRRSGCTHYSSMAVNPARKLQNDPPNYLNVEKPKKISPSPARDVQYRGKDMPYSWKCILKGRPDRRVDTFCGFLCKITSVVFYLY